MLANLPIYAQLIEQTLWQLNAIEYTWKSYDLVKKIIWTHDLLVFMMGIY